ncbi:MAG: hypothetical protein RXN91_10445 [Caldivirga sp.]
MCRCFHIFITIISPWFSTRSLQHARLRLIALMERKYDYRIITTMIHRQGRMRLANCG